MTVGLALAGIVGIVVMTWWLGVRQDQKLARDFNAALDKVVDS